MIIGQVLHRSSTQKYYSPWFPGEGDAATFAVEVIARSGATLKVQVHTKKVEDKDDPVNQLATGGTFADVTAVKVETKRATALLELVRYQIEVSGTSDTEWVHIRFTPPAWEFN